jgi:folate-binding protein YgfZ
MLPFVAVPSRAVIRARGRDATLFLQALFTNDVPALAAAAALDGGAAVPAQHGCFLSDQGRVLFDAIVARHPESAAGSEHLLVEVDARQADAAVAHFRKFKLRRKVEFALADDVAVAASGAGTAAPGGDSITFADPRQPLGLARHYVPAASVGGAAAGALYARHLAGLGVGEGQDVYRPQSLPFEANLDLLDGASFRKGCYIGQELTHRTHVMLVTRKRLVPLLAADGAAAELPSGPLFTVPADGSAAKPAPAGQAIAVGAGAAGVGVVRLKHQAPGKSALLSVGRDGPRVTATVPAWWPEGEFEKATRVSADQSAPV